MSEQEKKLLIFSAPSGAGKTTIVHHILQVFPDHLAFSVSACTRERRVNEQDGVDYHFLSQETFEKHIQEDGFAEWEEVYKDNFYGTLKSELERIWSVSKTVVFDIDVKGALNLKKQYGERALLIFVKPPSMDVLIKRLTSRQTETTEKINMRIAKAQEEMNYIDQFDVVLLNDHLAVACTEAEQITRHFLQLAKSGI